ncbi:cell division GTPase [Paenibacillus agilis]|nr:cell division GTPase [Paenibacillus agilis]
MTNKIDGVWTLEGIVEQKNAELGLLNGYVGIGQGGSKMVDAIAGIKNKAGNPMYPVMIVNSNVGDMTSLKNIPKRLQFALKGYDKGVGKDPAVGKQAFQENGAPIFNAIIENMGHCNMIYVVCSLGGGTGTGALNVLVNAISDHLGVPVSVICSMPRPNKIESHNAYNALAELAPKLRELREDDEGRTYRALESLVLLDNEKIILEHTNNPEVTGLTWDFYSNYKFASITHEWNVLSTLESQYTVDAADLSNHIITGGGLITYGKKRINLDEVRNKEDLISEIITTYKENNVLANGFDYENDMRAMAMVVVIPRERENVLNQDTLEIIRTRIMEELPNINFYPGFVTWGSKRNAVVYTMARLEGLPERAKNLRQEVEELTKREEESRQRTSGFDMGAIIESSSRTTTRRATGGNPFLTAASKPANTITTNPSINKPKTNPFEV